MFTLGTLNVQTLTKTGKLKELQYNEKVLVECSWHGWDTITGSSELWQSYGSSAMVHWRRWHKGKGYSFHGTQEYTPNRAGKQAHRVINIRIFKKYIDRMIVIQTPMRRKKIKNVLCVRVSRVNVYTYILWGNKKPKVKRRVQMQIQYHYFIYI